MKTKLLVGMLLLIAVAGTAQTNRRDKTRTTDGQKTETQVSDEKKEIKSTAAPQRASEPVRSSGVSAGESRRNAEPESRNASRASESRRDEAPQVQQPVRSTVNSSENQRSRETYRNAEPDSRNAGKASESRRNEAPRVQQPSGSTTNSVENQRNRETSRSSGQNSSSGDTPQQRRTYSDGNNRSTGNAGAVSSERRNMSSGRADNEPQRAGVSRSGNTYQPPVVVNGTRTVVYNGQTRVINVNERINDRRYHSNHVHYRHPVKVYVAPPVSVEVRRVKYPYRPPVYIDIYWTTDMYREYRTWYPEYCCWDYPIGYRIETVSAYDAIYYVGDIARVFGKVHEVYYAYENDEYYLYFGAPYPYQDFSAVVPGWVAREFSRRPIRWFQNRYVAITGLITVYEEKPEILVKRPSQIDRYY